MATNSLTISQLDHLGEFPIEWLPPSATVDCLLLFAGLKPAARLIVDSPKGINALRLWCEKANLDLESDKDGFVCITIDRGSAGSILALDRCTRAHEVELGLALGYPKCCCERIAIVGESSIDSYGQETLTWHYAGIFRRINPAGYSSGIALISHLPCSPSCKPSLSIANRAREFIVCHASEPLFLSLSLSSLVMDESH
jgi:hypothetical protein